MKIFTFLAVVCSALSCYAQNQGYYITNNGQKVEGYFKGKDFSDTAALKFAKTADGEYIKFSTESAVEYGIGDRYKSEKHTVNIDSYFDGNKNMSNQKAPEFISKAIFLEVILQSDASLYAYETNKGTVFFYKIGSKNIPLTQLVYKEYSVSQTEIAENNQFRQQLFNDVKCENADKDHFVNLDYERKPLLSVFEEYNNCTGYVSKVSASATEKKSKFKYTAFAGSGLTSLEIGGVPAEPDNSTTAGINAGVEMALTFTTTNWSFFGRAEFETYSTKTTVIYAPGSFNTMTNEYSLDNSNINIFVGPRYDFVLNAKNKIFADASVGITIPVSGSLEVHQTTSNASGTKDAGTVVYDLSSAVFLDLGVGYMFNNKFGAEIRLDTARNFMNSIQTDMEANVTRIGLNLRYTFN